MEALPDQFSATQLLLLAALPLFVTYLAVASSRRKGPPGPRPLPFLGNLLQLNLNAPEMSLVALSKRYGPVFTVHLGLVEVVVLAGYQAVKEALVKHDGVFGNRAAPRIFDEYNRGHGVLWSNGDTWRETRRFTLKTLRDLGMGKRDCEDQIQEEAQRLLQVVRGFQGGPFDTARPLNYAAANIICSLIYGRNFEYDDPQFVALVERLSRKNLLSGTALVKLYNLYPRLLWWASGRRQILEIAEADRLQNASLFAGLRETREPGVSRCLVDAFLARQQQIQESGEPNPHFSDENLLITVTNLFAAGTETSSTTLRWGLLYMAKYPEVQDQVREELRSVLGGRQVRLEDRKILHFTNAVVHETQRRANLIPTSLPHRTACDVVFQGHFISKGTTVLPLLETVLQDEAQWEQPDCFHPAHFLDSDGRFIKRDAFLPFSAGSRVCLGESLARTELFIFFSSLLQSFRFTPPPGVSEDELDLTPVSALTMGPAPHTLCAVPLP